jgi:hypothetical protein
MLKFLFIHKPTAESCYPQRSHAGLKILLCTSSDTGNRPAIRELFLNMKNIRTAIHRKLNIVFIIRFQR